MNILIPCAGAGKRFQAAGYTMPKPLIPVHGVPMIQHVTRNLGYPDNFHIYIFQQDHWMEHGETLRSSLHRIDKTFLLTNGLTQGAACTALLAEQFIDNDTPLLLANSDQIIVDWSSSKFDKFIAAERSDGCILTFAASHPKWSYARVAANGYITEVAEKNPISHRATVGIYYWAKGKDFVKYTKRMIAKDIRTNGEFYICPAFNEAIEDGLRISEYPVDGMMRGIGTPEDLTTYISP